ncbi:MAG: hypothetical protein LBG66_03280 [Gallionellaceae bacterium]|jgi:hypothetical protein|nr:hypothetical protein [Gallionellaceae bacterium]
MLSAARLALAGPPYLTDDPQPTDEGHWEIYNFVNGSHSQGATDGEAGFDLNYGAAKDVQLTAVLPAAYANDHGFFSRGLRGGAGVLELAVKYKILHQDAQGWMPDVAIFPRVFVPTDSRYGPPRSNFLLPIWAEKDFGDWSIFGGGGYQINPGDGQRNFWQGGIVVNRQISDRLSLGVELFAQTSDVRANDTQSGDAYRAVNFALTYKMTEHGSLLVSAGPTRSETGEHGAVYYLAWYLQY